ncbi:hypothetical protein FTX61_05510 [Nitriliruptoraceae bacterium ZYF776]|nr:hypothetical protein [Profundirhabdus halotolerans]
MTSRSSRPGRGPRSATAGGPSWCRPRPETSAPRSPSSRKGSFLPELLDPRRRTDKTLLAVIMTAYSAGISTRKVDHLVKPLGCDTGISKSSVSRICTGLNADVTARPRGAPAGDPVAISAHEEVRLLGRS